MADRTHRRSRSRAHGKEDPSRPRPPTEGVNDRWHDLQRAAGNAAVTSLLHVQRDEDEGGQSLLSMRPPAKEDITLGGASRPTGSLVPKLTPEQLASIFAEEEAKQDRLRPLVTRWLEAKRGWISDQVIQGTLSMPELVALIRDEVEGAMDVPPVFIEQVAKQHLGRGAPPRTRRQVSQAGVLSEIAAIISSATSARIKVGTDAVGLTVGITGVVTGKVEVGGVEASVEADAKKAGIEGVKGKAKVGPVGVQATHKSVGLDIEFPFVGGSKGKLKGSVSKGGAWKVGISLPLAGSKPIAAHPTAEAIGKSVREAEAAAREIVSVLNRGEEPDEAALENLASKVGSALKTVEKVAKPGKSATGPQLTLDLGVEGGQRELPGAGDAVKVPELKGGLNVVLRF